MSTPISVLFEHRDFVRRLARSLVRDDATADDLEGEVWAAAVARPPEDRGSPRAWLGQVTRNLHQKRQVRERRRSAREVSQASAELGPSPEEILERDEACRALTREVLALPERDQAPIRMRFYDGLPPSEIARRLGVPVETVKTRLRRALERLRGRMNAEEERRGTAFGVALVAVANEPLATTVVVGGAAVVKSAAVAVALLIAITAFVWTLGDDDPGAATGSGPGIESAGPVDSPPGSSEPARSIVPEAADVAVEVVTGRCVDGEARPVAGVRILVDEVPDLEEVRTGPDGRFRFEVPRPAFEEYGSVRLSTRSGGWARAMAELAAGAGGRVGDFVLAPAVVVRGSVEDAAGRPVRDARVMLQLTLFDTIDWMPPALCETTTDDRGRFVLDDCPAGTSVVQVVVGGDLVTWSDSLELGVGVDFPPLEFVTSRASDATWFRIRIVAADGMPANDHEVYVGVHRPSGGVGLGLRTDETGMLAVRVRGDETVSVRVSGRGGEVRADDLIPTEEVVVLRMTRRELATVTVRSSVDGARIHGAWCTPWRDGETAGETVVDSGDVGGGLVIGVPDELFELVIGGPSHRSARLGPFEPATFSRRIDVELDPGASVHGFVWATGAPVADAWIKLLVAASDGDGYEDVTADHAQDGISTETTEGGRYALHVPAPGEYYLHVDHPSFAPTLAGPFRLDPARAPTRHDVTLTIGAVIEGTVTFTDGFDPAGSQVSVIGEDRSATVDATGRYRLEGVSPGPVRIEVEPPRHWRRRAYPDGFGCAAADAETTRLDLAVRLHAKRRVTGRVLVAGRPATFHFVVLEGRPPATGTPATPSEAVAASERGSNERAGEFRGDGGFAVPVEHAGAYRLTCWIRRPGTEAYVALRAPIDVRDDDVSRDFLVETGSLRLRFLQGDGADVALLWLGADGAYAHQDTSDFTRLEDGALLASFVPAGRVLLQRGDGPVVETVVHAGGEQDVVMD